jgi:hypothetical protein
MSYNMMIGYDIYDRFTMEQFRLRQRMTLTTKIYCSRLYLASTPPTMAKLQLQSLRKFRSNEKWTLLKI